MLVNGTNISTYGAVLLEKEIKTAEIVVFDDWLRQSLNPLYLGKQEQYKAITTKFLIVGATENACLLSISTFVSQLKVCTIKFDDNDLYYDCVISSVSHTALVEVGYFELTVEFKAGYGYTAEVTETMTGVLSKNITVLGNLPTPAIVTATVTINTASRLITGFGSNITINTMLANVPVIINGILCTVLQNGSNKFGETEFTAFPVLQPGLNTITVDNTGCSLSIKYKAKYL